MMLKRLKIVALSLAVMWTLAAAVVRAEEYEIPTNRWVIGPEIYYFRYEEPDIDVEFDGLMYGLAGSFTHHHANRVMFTAEGRGAWGQVDYTGSGTIDDIEDWTAEGRLAVGYDFPKDGRLLTPFIGIGYRYLNDDSSGRTSSTGAAGYERESNYFYGPIGLEFSTALSEGWRIGLSGEFDILWKGRQISHLEDADPGFNEISNDQDSGYGARGSVRLQKRGERFDLLIEPFIRWWSIDDSKSANVTFSGVIVGTGYEPKNETLEVGGAISVRF